MDAVEANLNIWRSIAKLQAGEIFYFGGDQVTRQPIQVGTTYMTRKLKSVNRRETILTLEKHLRAHIEFCDWFFMMMSLKENRYANDMLRILKESVDILPNALKGMEYYRQSMVAYDHDGFLSFLWPDPQDDAHDASCQNMINKLLDHWQRLVLQLIQRGILPKDFKDARDARDGVKDMNAKDVNRNPGLANVDIRKANEQKQQ
jgi:hypothetical protein